jgi:hypothetical protein
LFFPLDMKRLSIVLFSLLTTSLFSQGPIITPLKGNSRLSSAKEKVLVKRAAGDTLKLPFFDDFTTTEVYPDARMWLDKQVYINSTFPISPPSYGVATFDNLNSKGAPYKPLSGFSQGPSDSLTSRTINLKTYKSGLNTLNYSLADSIYLSFFYQTQGLGDPLDATDSLVLKFKDTGGDWRTVWRGRGTAVKPFQQVMIGILDARYLSAGFQFRFINFGKNTGNMNQWHIDYVRMKSSRNLHDTAIDEIAINAVPIGPLRLYESMPYTHYKADIASNTLDSHYVVYRNNNPVNINVFYGGEIRNKFNKVIQNYPLSVSRNTKAFTDDTFSYNPFRMDTFSTKEPIVRLKYTISAGANDLTAGDYTSIGNNNEYVKSVYFRNYYAYDDGSAEGGYGLDYGSLPAGPGYSALKFQLFKADTLRGISVFFNRSVADVSFKPFTMMVWQNISEPPASNTNNDVILKKVEIPTSFYADSINGFVNIVFDTAVILPTGNFYIGWQQTSNYILNVGYDNNYKHLHQGGRNPNLFYNLNGYWEKVNSNISGVPMMRPLLGGKIYNPASIRRTSTATAGKVFLYPNPSGNSSTLALDSEKEIHSVKVYDISGKVCLELNNEDIREINISELPPGFYQVLIGNADKQVSIHKYIKN